MSTNKTELVKVDEYGTIASNDESKNIFIFCFISFPYTLQEDMESYVKQKNIMTLFAMQYRYLLDGIYNVFMSIHLKMCDCPNEHCCYSQYWR